LRCGHYCFCDNDHDYNCVHDYDHDHDEFLFFYFLKYDDCVFENDMYGPDYNYDHVYDHDDRVYDYEKYLNNFDDLLHLKKNFHYESVNGYVHYCLLIDLQFQLDLNLYQYL
jgi:hypothetical protein